MYAGWRGGHGGAQAACRASGLILGRGCWRACQRSHCVCRPSQCSGVVPSHAERRSAILAVMPALPFSRLESVTRLICRACAACVTLTSGGSHSRNTSPGCGGLCILLMFVPLMVVLIIDEDRIGAVERGRQAPIAVHPDHPVPGKIALQRMQSPGRRMHVLRAARLIQRTGRDAQPGRVMRLDSAFAAFGEKRCRTFVPKGFDRGGL